jgi:hypothetical protein
MVKGAGDPFLLHQKLRTQSKRRGELRPSKTPTADKPNRTFRDPAMLEILEPK